MSDKVTEVLMPSMGEGITEATLVKWLKVEGEKVEKDSPLLEVSTDKVDTEIPAPASGYLIKTLVKPQDVVAVNAVIAFISADKNAEIPKDVTVKSGREAKSSHVPAESHSSRPVFEEGREIAGGESGGFRSSPLVRKIARDVNLNLAAVAGRGLHGRVTKKDVFNFLDSVRTGIQESLTPGWDSKTLKTSTLHGQEFLEGVPVRRERMSKSRELIAEHMARSMSIAPHATTVFEMDLNHIYELREKNKDSFNKKHGIGLTYTHFVTYACVQALKEFPLLNCSVDGSDLLFKDDINIGLAVALETNLVVPVVKRAQEKNFLELVMSIQDLVTRARNKKLSPEEVQGGTFSITNPGIFGSLTSNPIINQPQVAILCMGVLTKRPVVVADKIVVRPMMHIGITFDHRAVDGEGAAKFLGALQKNLENVSI